MFNFDVVVIGGGATGAGIARDSAMRGFKTLLIEKGELGSGTSGKYHGLLHSGARYVVDDPEAAHECIRENRIIKKIAASAIEDTGGMFLLTPDDDPDYAEQFFNACKQIGIPVEELSINNLLQQEPLLNPRLERAFSVPDAACDSQKLIRMNIASAKEYGAEVLTHHEVTGLTLTYNKITAITVIDIRTNEAMSITCNFVINAAGAFADTIAKMANISFSVLANKGSMLVMNKRMTKAILNRCRKPGDGDILTHSKETSIIGTTSYISEDPNNLQVEAWEKKLLLEEGEKLIKNFSSYEILYGYAGIRPLFQSDLVTDARLISRSFVLKNHQDDGLDNFVSIFGGKLTTYRFMAQEAVDAMCDNLNVKRECKTAQELLPTNV